MFRTNHFRDIWCILVIGLVILLNSCKSVSKVTETTSSVKIETICKDSVIYRDSIIPVERYVDIAREYDTLTLETSLAKAQCWVDSIFLKGIIENKKAVKYKYVGRWSTTTNDSLVCKEKVDYVETIKYKANPVNKFTLLYSIFLTLIALVFVLRHFRK